MIDHECGKLIALGESEFPRAILATPVFDPGKNNSVANQRDQANE
jgi:hypothetical protein